MRGRTNLYKSPSQPPFEQTVILTNPEKVIPDLEPDIDSIYTNEYGCIRRSKIHFEYGIGNLALNEVVKYYTTWRDDPEYFILRGITEGNLDQQRLLFKWTNELEDTWYTPNDTHYIYKFVKASKRGNDVYKHLVNEKLKSLRNLYNIQFFDEHSADKRTSALFVTLTYDTKRCDPDTAWRNIGKDFHLFHNNLRKKYGDVEIFRTWESTDNYYPHVHALILFWDTTFTVLSHTDKDGEVSYRIPYSQKKKIAGYWHSNIDIQAIKDTEGGIKELTKYITKDLCSKKGDKTNAMIWLHRKQSYALSKRFIENIQGWNIDFNEPTNADLINNMCNCNRDVVKWEFLGIVRGIDLRFSPDIWVVTMKKPPPRVVELVKKEYIRWNATHRGRY